MKSFLIRAVVLVSLVSLATAASIAPAQTLPAFPGAEGFGAEAVGGRGGRVLEVTTLDDSGPGSLRAAVEAEGARTVVFRVGGVIELRSEMVLTNPYITIAGQTAPGGGITLTTHPSNPRSALTIKGGAHDVVVRFLCIRPSPPTRRERPDDDSHVQDALQILDASRVIIDHCSFSWATDEVVSTFSSAREVTIQWCVIAEALRNTQRGGVDGKGLLLGGPRAERISAHHNLLVHNLGRNPMIKSRGAVDVVNNVVLAPANTAIVVDGEYGRTPVNLVGNYVLAPNGDGLVHGVRVLGMRPVSLFVQGNYGPKRTQDSQPQELFVDPANQARSGLLVARHEMPRVTTLPAEAAYERVLEEAGCTRPTRDAVDERIVQDVRQRRTRLIEDPSEVGGLPDLAGGVPPSDSDHDGMPDDWERQHGLNPADPSDGPADHDGDGYTNLEEFLNSTDPPPVSRGYTIPLVDLAGQTSRQVIVDREAGQYLGHPTTVLLEDGRTMIIVYPKGHGRGAIVMKRSTDGGKTWSPRLPTPKSWETSLETPTIHRVVDAEGNKRLIMFSGLYPIRMAASEDDGRTWSELKPIGDFGGIVAMGSVERLRNGDYMALFHDDGRFIRSGSKPANPKMFHVYKTLSRDGGLTWSQPDVITVHPQAHLCEPGLIRSPDGQQLCVLLRENSRKFNSFVIFSDDEGRTWSTPRELPAALTGDRHVGKYAPDGRLFITFRDTTHESATKGDWVGWVGRYEDIVAVRQGQYRVRLMDNHKGADCAYPGLEMLPDGTFVTTTYGHWQPNQQAYIVSVRFKLEELDALRGAR